VATAEMRFLHGFIEGRTEGFIAGRAGGDAQLLVHVLTARFGPLPDGVSYLVYDAAQQVAIDKLKTWMARTVTAEALDQIFDLLPATYPSPRLWARESPLWTARRPSRDG
jgi:hypothetical protein